MECIICYETDSKKSFVKKPSLDALKTLLERTRERANFKDASVTEFFNRIENETAENLLKRKVNYHDKCYSSFANSSKLERARKRFLDSITSSDSSVIKRKKGRPSTSETVPSNDDTVPRTRSNLRGNYDKALRIICQLPGGKTCKVAFKETGVNMLSVAKNLGDKSFYLRPNSIHDASDAIANDVLYHNLCWAKAKRLAQPKSKPIENYSKTLTDIELLNIIEIAFQQDPSKTLDMNFINQMYINILIENGADSKNVSSNYKKQIKELLSENLPNIVFVKSPQLNKPEQVISQTAQSKTLSSHMESIADENDLRSLWKLAKNIQQEVLNQSWEFQGTFDDYKIPAILSIFMKWTLFGPHMINSENKESQKVSNIIKATTQFVTQNIKTTRQSIFKMANLSN